MAYRPRRFATSPLYRLLQDHWESFLGAYEEEYQHTFGALRSVAERVVGKFLDCGNPLGGFARIRCPECGYERLLAFSCKCALCPSCQARRAQEWAFWLCENRLEGVPHHHVVFTIPKMLRAYFRFDRSLLNELSRAAHRAVLTYCQGLLDVGVRPGVIIVRQTFGKGARFHPHLHALVTGGGWDADGVWQPMFGWDRPVLRELFEVEVFRFLRQRGLLSAERMQLIRSWRHSGFGVHVGEAIGPEDRQSLEHVARYLLRAPVSLERMRYDPQTQTVTIRPLAAEGNEPVELQALEFIARLIQHIPDVQERQVVYYGIYANASRLGQSHRKRAGDSESSVWIADLEEPTPFERRRRIRWAQLIQRVWLEDPLLCPNCGGKMGIISFITELSVIDKILRHLKWRPGDALEPGSRSPPELLAVAESS